MCTQMRDPELYRLSFRHPADCALPNCNAFIGIDTNTGDPSLLDITMQGLAGGWLAIGFSPTPSMVSNSVAHNSDRVNVDGKLRFHPVVEGGVNFITLAMWCIL